MGQIFLSAIQPASKSFSARQECLPHVTANPLLVFVLVSYKMSSLPADVAELADALDSGSSGRKVVEVQVLSSALEKYGRVAMTPSSGLDAVA